MGYGERRDKPLAWEDYIRTLGTLHAYRIRCNDVFSMFLTFNRTLSSITTAVDKYFTPSIIRSCCSLVFHRRIARLAKRVHWKTCEFFTRDRTRTLELRYSRCGNSFLRSIRAPFSREALLTFCSRCEVVLSS